MRAVGLILLWRVVVVTLTAAGRVSEEVSVTQSLTHFYAPSAPAASQNQRDSRMMSYTLVSASLFRTEPGKRTYISAVVSVVGGHTSAQV